MNMIEKKYLEKKAAELIGGYFGPSTAERYEKYFATLDEETMRLVVEELITETVGPENAKKQLESLYS
jgi:DNA-directed RNA polymerase subunit F